MTQENFVHVGEYGTMDSRFDSNVGNLHVTHTIAYGNMTREYKKGLEELEAATMRLAFSFKYGYTIHINRAEYGNVKAEVSRIYDSEGAKLHLSLWAENVATKQTLTQSAYAKLKAELEPLLFAYFLANAERLKAEAIAAYKVKAREKMQEVIKHCQETLDAMQ